MDVAESDHLVGATHKSKMCVMILLVSEGAHKNGLTMAPIVRL